MAYMCVYGKERGAKAVGSGGGKGKTQSLRGTLQVAGYFITILIDCTTVDTFFAQQQEGLGRHMIVRLKEGWRGL